MAEEATIVRSQMIALESLRLVLPNTAIAEVVSYSQLELPEGKPDWFLGYASWRGYQVPVVSFEVMINQRGSKPTRRSRIIILNSISADPDRAFYGLLATGIPRLMSLDETSIQNAPEIGDTDPLILRQVIADKNAAIIPDQYELEATLKKNKLALMAEE
ncbi:MAG: chemotaxis protein CheW [Gammaproteobacteria bacterium]|jgi:chemosensory pili system protein ChpC